MANRGSTIHYSLHRYPNRGAQPPHRAVAEHDVAAMGAGDVAGDGKPEAAAAFVLVARVVEAKERLEDLVAQMRRNPWTVVIDRNRHVAVVALSGDGNGPGKACG